MTLELCAEHRFAARFAVSSAKRLPNLLILLQEHQTAPPADHAYGLALAEPHLRFPHHANDLFGGTSLPRHVHVSSLECGNSRIRSISLVSFLASSPTLLRWRSGVVKQLHDLPPLPIHAVTNF